MHNFLLNNTLESSNKLTHTWPIRHILYWSCDVTAWWNTSCLHDLVWMRIVSVAIWKISAVVLWGTRSNRLMRYRILSICPCHHLYKHLTMYRKPAQKQSDVMPMLSHWSPSLVLVYWCDQTHPKQTGDLLNLLLHYACPLYTHT